MPGYGCPGPHRTSNAKGGHKKHETDRRRQTANGAETLELCSRIVAGKALNPRLIEG